MPAGSQPALSLSQRNPTTSVVRLVDGCLSAQQISNSQVASGKRGAVCAIQVALSILNESVTALATSILREFPTYNWPHPDAPAMLGFNCRGSNRPWSVERSQKAGNQ